MGSSRAPLSLLPLLLFLALAGGGAAHAQHKDVVYLDLATIDEVQGIGPAIIVKEEIITSTTNSGGSSRLCSACEDLASKAVGYLSDKRTQDKIVEILHDACSQTFSLEQKCVELMDSYATLLFTKVTEIQPQELCKHYGLCRETTSSSSLSDGAMSVTSDGTCVLCHQLLDQVMSKLKDPDAEFEVIQILLKECSKMEGHVQQCKRLVLQYIPLILVNGEKFLEKNDVCALVQACDAGQQRKSGVGSFLEVGLLTDA